MSIIGTIYEDVTSDVLGDIGSWQWLVTFMATILMTGSFFNHYEDIFLLHPSQVYCYPPEDIENIANQSLCTFQIANKSDELRCDQWNVKILWMIWMKKSWLLFCEDETNLLLTAIIYRLALIFGFVIFGLVADSFGRRTAIIINIFGSVVLRLVLTFYDSKSWFRLALFLESLFGSAIIFVGLVIVCEIASNRWRSWLNVIVISPRLLAAVSMVPLVNSASNVETYNVIAGIFGLLYIVVLKWLPESPQWMLYNRKIYIAEKLLYKAALQNEIRFSADFKIRPVNNRAYNCLDETMTCVRVLTVHNIRVIICASLAFWGLLYFLWSSLYLQIYYNNEVGKSMLFKILFFLFLMGASTMFLSTRLAIHTFLLINIMFTGIFMVASNICKQRTMYEIFSSVTIASALMVNAIILNVTPRLYAINVRATLLGCCHATGQIGAMISYLLFIYKSLDDIVFMALDMGIIVMLLILSFVFPHVDGRELPDMLEDMDYFSELSKPLRWATQKRTSPSKEEVEIRVYSFGSVPASTSQADQPQPATRRPFAFMAFWRWCTKNLLREPQRNNTN